MTIAAAAPEQSLLVSASRSEGTVEPTPSTPWWDEPWAELVHTGDLSS